MNIQSEITALQEQINLLKEKQANQTQLPDWNKDFKDIPINIPFLMGNTDEHQAVILTKPYQMCDHTVTEKEWSIVMSTVYATSEADLPKVNISWNDCQEFIKKLNESQDEWEYSLPTEAEWEWACKGGSLLEPKNIDEVAWHYHNSDERLHEGKELKPNGFGLYDMLGNVWEFCQDSYTSYKDVKDEN